MNNFYSDKINEFNKRLTALNLELLPYDEEEVEICKKISNLKVRPFFGDLLTNFYFYDSFMNAIEGFNSKTRKYYNNIVNRIIISPNPNVESGHADTTAHYGKIGNIFLTAEPLREMDFIAFSHEMGHLPFYIDNSKEDYYEYIEAFPMFLEYLACKYLVEDDLKAKERYLRIIMERVNFAANFIINKDKEITGDNEVKDTYLYCEEREYYRYITSAEFAMQLIERMDKNRFVVNHQIDKYVNHDKSMKDIAKKLDIDVKGCKTLVKVADNFNSSRK